METEIQDLKKKILECLKSQEYVRYDILYHELDKPKKLRNTLQILLSEGFIQVFPVKSSSKWHWVYSIKKPGNKIPIGQTLEEIFEELAIPPFMDIMINRGFKVIFIGKYGSRPGFSIIDFSCDPPLIFKDIMYGGEKEEIIFFKQRSKYICKKGDIEIWYNLHGRKMYIKS